MKAQFRACGMLFADDAAGGLAQFGQLKIERLLAGRDASIADSTTQGLHQAMSGRPYTLSKDAKKRSKNIDLVGSCPTVYKFKINLVWGREE